jgi:dipeptidyl aminopeptidase/acylaminoacyl peptidase
LFFFFSSDDRTLLYLREPRHGSELYHLFAIDLDGDRKPRDLIKDPKMTCAIGFIGGVQIWTMPHLPRKILLSTGFGSLFWDISMLDLDTAECKIVERNVMSTWLGKAYFVLASLWSVVVAFLTRGLIKPTGPSATVQWFPDRNLQFRGRLDARLSDLSATWTVRPVGVGWKALQVVSFDDLNMQLVGSSGGAGTARMDFSASGDTVDVHSCVGADTTSYVRFDVESGKELTRLANNAKSDITGFMTHPVTKAVQCVLYEYERPDIACVDRSLERDIRYLQQHFDRMAFRIVGRTTDDSVWAVYAYADHGQTVCAGCPSAYFLYTRSPASSPTASAVSMLFAPRPTLADYTLSSMQPVHVRARDGEDILCYLSSPPPGGGSNAAENAKSLKALVVMPHGGPQARDCWGYDAVCHLLCSRGMHVLQVLSLC